MSAKTTPTPHAVIFDAYGTLFDVHSVVAASEQLFPGHGDALSQLWRKKQIEYTQLRSLADPAGARYRPFWHITLDALRYAARRLGLPLTAGAEKRLMDEYACLSAFPDTLPVLRALRAQRADGTAPGLAILSNGSPEMLDIAVKSAGMGGLFDHVLSVDAVRAYKPSPTAYALATQAFGTAARHIVFVSSNGWNAAGARWFGFRTFWLNRHGAPLEELGVMPDGTGASLPELLAFLRPAGRSGAGASRTGSSCASTSDPGTSSSGTPNSGRPDPGTPDPGTPDPGTPDPGTPTRGSPAA